MKKSLLLSIIAIIFTFAMCFTKADASWFKDGKGWWNSEDNGYSIGWRYLDNKWYFFNNEGYMVTGWLLTDSKWYYFYEDGSMARATTIGEYYLDNEGAWVEPEVSNCNIIDDDTIKETIFNNLSDNEKKRITDYKSGTIFKIILEEGDGTINDKSYIGKEIYLVDFPVIPKGSIDNTIIYVSIDKLQVIGHGYVD